MIKKAGNSYLEQQKKKNKMLSGAIITHVLKEYRTQKNIIIRCFSFLKRKKRLVFYPTDVSDIVVFYLKVVLMLGLSVGQELLLEIMPKLILNN